MLWIAFGDDWRMCILITVRWDSLLPRASSGEEILKSSSVLVRFPCKRSASPGAFLRDALLSGKGA